MPRYSPQDFGYTGTGTPDFASTVLHGGDVQANLELQKGQALNYGIGALGGALGQAWDAQQQKQAQAQATQRDATFMQMLQQSGGLPDPAQTIGMYGPEQGIRLLKGLSDFHQMKSEQGPAALKRLPGVIRGIDVFGDDARAASWPEVKRTMAEAGLPASGIPDQYTPDVWPKAMALADELDPPKPKEVKTREIKRTMPDGSIETSIVEDKPGQVFPGAPEPPKPPQLQHVETSLGIQPFDPTTGKLGPVIGQRPMPPKAPPEPVGAADSVNTTMSGRQYININDFEPKDREQARKEAAAAGIMVLQKEDANSLRSGDNARANLGAILNQVEAKLPRDAAGRVTAAPSNKLAQFFQTDADLGAFNSWRVAAIQSVQALAESGKGFRMTKAEIDLAIQNDIPNITDDIQTARQKVKNFNTLMDNKESSILTRDRSSLANPGGATPGRPSGGAPQAMPKGPTIKTKAEFDALPSGTVFIDPEGNARKKP